MKTGYNEPEGTTHIDGDAGEYRFLKQVGKAYLLWNGQRWTHPVAPRETVKTLRDVFQTGMPSIHEARKRKADPAGFKDLPVLRQPDDKLFELWRFCWAESGMKRVNKTVFVGREYGRDFDEAVKRHIRNIGEENQYYSGWYDSFYPSKDAAPDDFMPDLIKDKADKYEVPYE